MAPQDTVTANLEGQSLVPSAVAVSEPTLTEAAPTSSARGLLRLARPHQWTKNILVFAAPFSAGAVTHLHTLLFTALAGAVFLALSVATYLVNDVVDAPADRLHPVKRTRPVASGVVSPRLALTTAAVLAASGLVAAGLTSSGLLACAVAYLLITSLYSFGIKELAVVELAFVAAGFVIRAAAGAATTHLAISPWFLIVVTSGALLIVAGKRSAEFELLGEDRARHRIVLGQYTASFLRSTRIVAMGTAATAYCLWVFDRSAQLIPAGSGRQSWFDLSIIPFVLVIMALELAIEQGRGGEPEEIALKDRSLQILGASWLVLFAMAIYA